MSIAFEVDGPYKAMILPASDEEGKLLKKRYAVFNLDGSLAELKGFELKRRGELRLIKAFQEQVFDKFLEGSTLAECYAAVAAVASQWLDVVDGKGTSLSDEEVIEIMSETKSMSKALDEYGAQKSSAISCARRLAEFLGEGMVKNEGLACKFIVADRPHGAPVTERAMPVAIFSAEDGPRRFYLKKWLKDPGMTDYDIRSVIDWSYYRERLEATVRKIITIPAGCQRLPTPLPRVRDPDWLRLLASEREDKHKQRTITELYKAKARRADADADAAAGDGDGDEPKPTQPLGDAVEDAAAMDDGAVGDLEDISGGQGPRIGATAVVRSFRRRGGDVGGPNGDGGEGGVDVAPATPGNGALTSPAGCSPPPGKRLGGDGAAAGETMTTPASAPVHICPEWLDARKRTWQGLREARKRFRRSGRTADPTTAAPARAVSAKAPRVGSGAPAIRAPWHILEIAETDKPGELTVWGLVDGVTMHSVTLVVQRELFINCRDPPKDIGADMRPATRQLPRGVKGHHVYRLCLDEAIWQASGGDVGPWLAGTDALSVHHSQIPPITRALIDLGAVCAVNAHARRKPLHEDFALTDLYRRDTGSGQNMGAIDYLRGGRLRINFVYETVVSAGDRGAVLLYELHTSPRRITVIFLMAGGSRADPPPTAARARAIAAQLPADANLLGAGADAEEGDVEFSVETAPNADSARQRVSRHIAQGLGTRSGRRGAKTVPTITLVQSALQKTTDLRTAYPALAACPVALVPENEADKASWQSLIGDPWRAQALEIALLRCAKASGWWEEAVFFAGCTQIPVGNLAAAREPQAIDILYARRLEDDGQLLWASRGPDADLGGHARNPQTRAEEADGILADLSVVTPAVRRDICVTFAVHSLPVAAIVESKSAEMAREEDAADGATMVGPALKILRNLVHEWSAAGQQRRCHAHVTTSLLEHCYYWLVSPRSFLHDSALTCLVRRGLRRYWSALLDEVRALGCDVVYADLSTFILGTGVEHKPPHNCGAEFHVTHTTAPTHPHATTPRLRPARYRRRRHLGGLPPAVLAGEARPPHRQPRGQVLLARPRLRRQLQLLRRGLLRRGLCQGGPERGRGGGRGRPAVR